MHGNSFICLADREAAVVEPFLVPCAERPSSTAVPRYKKYQQV
jgi:hypothetical protein